GLLRIACGTARLLLRGAKRPGDISRRLRTRDLEPAKSLADVTARPAGPARDLPQARVPSGTKPAVQVNKVPARPRRQIRCILTTHRRQYGLTGTGEQRRTHHASDLGLHALE